MLFQSESAFKSCKKAFGSVTLTHTEPQRFCSSRWMTLLFYLPYRFVMAFYPVGWFIYSINLLRDTLKWPIFLTNWFFLMLLLYFQMVFWLTVYRWRKSKRYTLVRSHLIFVEQYIWVCFNVLVSLGPSVMLVYWIFLFQEESYTFHLASGHEFVVFPSMIILEILLSDMPLRLAHMYCPVVWGIGYVGFAIGYQFGGQTSIDGGNYVYSVISDFKGSPLESVSFSVVWVLSLALFFALATLLVWLRDRLASKMCPNLNKVTTDEILLEKR